MKVSSLVELKRRTIFHSLGQGLRHRTGTLDVIVPVSGKDSHCLEQALAAARRCPRHEIGRIYVVYHERPSGVFLSAKDVIMIDERDVAPVRKASISYHPQGVDRSGWLFQQLIKLSSDKICKEEHILALDSDTVLMRPQRLIKNGRVVLNVSDERHEPYYRMVERLLPGTAIFPYSFVSHHMLFTRSYLREMKVCLERRGKPWFEAILDDIDPEEMSGFSEYELYGNYMTAHHPGSVCVEHCLNKSFAADWVRRLWYVKLRHPLIKSASFHNR
jgi:Family of unknown function (DUF6492)